MFFELFMFVFYMNRQGPRGKNEDSCFGFDLDLERYRQYLFVPKDSKESFHIRRFIDFTSLLFFKNTGNFQKFLPIERYGTTGE
jgi:hypothetical protein